MMNYGNTDWPALPPMSALVNQVHCMDALELLAMLPDNSVDAVISDPPYPEIDRDYGRLTEIKWMELMQACVLEFKRVLKPSGSAVLILQSNSENVGKMRLWLWDFMSWAGHTWNIVQDVYWWNYATAPTIHCNRDVGLMRPSVKNCVWLGDPNCFRNQSDVMWYPSDSMLAKSFEDRALVYHPSGAHMNSGRIAETVKERGGVTPFNLIPMTNSNSTDSGGSHGHGAATPEKLMEWWVKYVSKPNDLVLDPFMGSGTTALVARDLGRNFIGSELNADYMTIIRNRLAKPYTPDMFIMQALEASLS